MIWLERSKIFGSQSITTSIIFNMENSNIMKQISSSQGTDNTTTRFGCNNLPTLPTNSVFHFLQKRRRSELAFPHKLLKPYVTRKLPQIFRAREYNMGTIDKIFASHWLDDTKVVYGTKCNKLCILNVINGKSVSIPMVQGPTSPDPESNCGIHSLQFNPSHTMLATGGENPNDLCVYKLPEFEPVYLGVGHSDWIFDLVWLNDHHVVTGSRDGCMGIWDTKYCKPMSIQESAPVCIKKPLSWLKSIYSDEKVRAIQYNSHSMQLASLSTKAILHIWDVNRIKSISSVELPYQQENICLCLEPAKSLYAVGSQSHVTLLDGRCPSNLLRTVKSVDQGAGIRSLSFHNMLVTIGTGFGSCSFLDLRTNKFLHNSNGSICQLKAGEGWLHRDDVYYSLFGDICFPNAIYTHCYDPTGSKLFTGGGPLAVGLHGNYAALWQ